MIDSSEVKKSTKFRVLVCGKQTRTYKESKRADGESVYYPTFGWISHASRGHALEYAKACERQF